MRGQKNAGAGSAFGGRDRELEHLRPGMLTLTPHYGSRGSVMYWWVCISVKRDSVRENSKTIAL